MSRSTDRPYTLEEPEDRDRVSVQAVSLLDFAAVEEPGVDAIIGTTDSNLLPVGGDAMFYGDGGAGKTTLAVDMAFHVATGTDWLGFPVVVPRTVLLIENEGPRPLFRRKLRRKLESWKGPELDPARLLVWAEPWNQFRFSEKEDASQLSRLVFEHEIDLLIAGPVTQLGMEDAGTITEVRKFAELVAAVRRNSLRPLTTLLIHHESKSGRVSGAWEGVGDTMIHVYGAGHGRTRMLIQKARWAPEHHSTTMHLRWGEEMRDGSFSLDEAPASKPERSWDAIIEYVRRNGGCEWSDVVAVPGISNSLYMRRRRDAAIDEGVLVDRGTGDGRNRRFSLWHQDDPGLPQPLQLVPDVVRSGGLTEGADDLTEGDTLQSPNTVSTPRLTVIDDGSPGGRRSASNPSSDRQIPLRDLTTDLTTTPPSDSREFDALIEEARMDAQETDEW